MKKVNINHVVNISKYFVMLVKNFTFFLQKYNDTHTHTPSNKYIIFFLAHCNSVQQFHLFESILRLIHESTS